MTTKIDQRVGNVLQRRYFTLVQRMEAYGKQHRRNLHNAESLDALRALDDKARIVAEVITILSVSCSPTLLPHLHSLYMQWSRYFALRGFHQDMVRWGTGILGQSIEHSIAVPLLFYNNLRRCL